MAIDANDNFRAKDNFAKVFIKTFKGRHIQFKRHCNQGGNSWKRTQ